MNDELQAKIARVRALLAKASLGPWELAGDSPAHIVVLDDETGSIVGHIAEAGRDDAELIAALRNAAQDLLDAAERAQKLEEALRKIQALDDGAECCGQGVFTGPPYPECCNQPLYGLDRAKALSIRALKEPTNER